MYEAKEKEKEEYFKILESPEYRNRLGLTSNIAIAKHLGINNNTLTKWRKHYEKKNGNKKESFDVKAFLQDNKEEIAKNLLRVIKESGNPRGVELALNQLGELTDKVGNQSYTATEVANDVSSFVELVKKGMTETGVCPICGTITGDFNDN